MFKNCFILYIHYKFGTSRNLWTIPRMHQELNAVDDSKQSKFSLEPEPLANHFTSSIKYVRHFKTSKTQVSAAEKKIMILLQQLTSMLSVKIKIWTA